MPLRPVPVARLAAALAVCLSGAAARADCPPPSRGGIVIDDGRVLLRGRDGAVVRCLADEVAALRRENRALRQRVDMLEAALAQAPVPYLAEDARVSAEAGRPVGRASFVLTARQTSQPAALTLDAGVVAALCGRPGGCRVTLVEAGEGLRRSDPAPRRTTGPCALTYATESGAWARAAPCGADAGAAAGVDGDGAGPGSAAGAGAAIIASAGRCHLADAPAERGPGGATPLAADRTRGLHLVALAGGAAAGRFRCELALD